MLSDKVREWFEREYGFLLKDAGDLYHQLNDHSPELESSRRDLDRELSELADRISRGDLYEELLDLAIK